MFSFCIAAITNKCKFSGLNDGKFITLQFWSQKSLQVKIKVLGSCCFHRFSGRFYSLPFSASRSCPPSLAHTPVSSFRASNTAFLIFPPQSPSPLTPLVCLPLLPETALASLGQPRTLCLFQCQLTGSLNPICHLNSPLPDNVFPGS